MRNFTRTIAFALLFINALVPAFAQESSPSQRRCASMLRLESLISRDPLARALHEQNQREGEALKKKYLSQTPENRQEGELSMNTLTAPVYIPVAVHIVLPDAMQISDEDVQKQIDKLNIDFAGLNADSAAIPPAFKPLFGKSKIQFTLARRTPSGMLTNGIERRNSATRSNFNLITDPIKRTSLGGLDAWDFNTYLNFWVGLDASGFGVLGYATFPGTDIPANQGVFVNALSWGNNSCYVIPQFGLGRSAVHEVGHYFGLYHIWGEESGCSGDDFRQLSGTCILPASLLVGDTPNQGDETTGCVSGVRTDACSPAAPGIMYQNFMDYTDDACYAMFTLKQVERMEYVLENCRASYLSSDGATPPTGAILTDASALEAVNPGGHEINGCMVTNFPPSFCAGSIIPKVRIVNNGLDTLKAVSVGMSIDNGAPILVNISTALPIGFTTVVSFPLTNFTNGPHTLKFFTQDPNNTVDQVPANDTLTINLVVGTAIPGPITEGFETTTFPPAGWSISNPDVGSVTWQRNTAGKKSGVASAYMNSYNYPGNGHLDYLLSPLVDVTGVDSIYVSFERAYIRYGTGAALSDTLMIQISNSCGITTSSTIVWKKGGNDLATVAGTFTGDWVPATSDWLREMIDIKPFLPPGSNSVQIAFVSKNGFGQNLYLDDINISTVTLPLSDASLRSINVPARVCSANLTPGVDIANTGKDPLISARIVYRITGPSGFNRLDSVQWNGNLTAGAVATVLLNPVTLGNAGNYNLIVYTKLPNGLPDTRTSNDTLRRTFRYVGTVPAPVFQSFETTPFPPTNWGLQNQDGQITWTRRTLAARSGVAAAFMDNYNYDAKGSNDDIETPIISYSGIDSAKLTFSVSHATYNYPGSTALRMDTLQVLVTKDCGSTYTLVYSKWGEDLQTIHNAKDPYTSFFIPNNPSQWRDETIDLTQVFGASGQGQVIFRNRGNFGNSIFIDNVNITTKTLPLKLKMNGYLISPNPFNTSFSVQHYLRPVDLRGIQVINAAGQVIFEVNYNGNAASYINIDLNRNAAGLYVVKLLYKNKVVTERVIKRQ